MNCPYCGKKLLGSDTKICNNCGKAISLSDQPQVVVFEGKESLRARKILAILVTAFVYVALFLFSYFTNPNDYLFQFLLNCLLTFWAPLLIYFAILGTSKGDKDEPDRHGFMAP
jgi:hypothetical protein